MNHKQGVNQIFIPLTLGATAFLLIAGLKILDPTYLGWVNVDNDPFMGYIGWAFYRFSPWNFPLGLNPNYGLDLASSIVYSDSVTIMAIVLKPFSRFLPFEFQYFGIWTLICFMFQSLFAWLLLGIFAKNVWVKLFGSAFFLFLPIMLDRIGMHAGLVAQFTILAALYLSFRKENHYQIIPWAALLFITPLIHFYLFIFVAVIWISFLLDSLFFKKSKLTFRQALASLAVSFIGTFFGMWQAGYFVIPSGDAGLWGYGTWAMNLLSFFNAFGWSYLLPPITSVTGIHNRFQYPGIGVFILIFFALLKISTSWMWLKNIFSKNIFLLASLFALTLFAITNYVSFGSLTFHFKLPNLLLTLGNTFRGSDRMFWPSVYAIIIAAIAIICKSYRTHIALLILGCTAIVQIVDTAAGWIPLHQRLNSYSNSLPVLPFNNAFWNVAAQKYKGVIVINDGRNTQADNWRDFSRFALQNNMESGAASLARFDLLKLTKMISEFRDEAFRDNLLYIVSDEELPRYITKVQRGRDLVARIDGFNVIAPAWLQCEQCVLVDDSDFKRPQAPFTENNKSIYFSSKDSTSISFLISGWDNSSEEWGVWSNASKARLTIPLPSKNPKNLVLNLRAFVSKKNPMQKFQIFENNKFLGIFTANKFDNNLFVIPVTAAAVREGFIDLNFNFDRPKSPKELSLGDDDRKLSIGLISATFIK